MTAKRLVAAQRDADARLDELLALRATLRTRSSELDARKAALGARRSALAADNGGGDVRPSDRIKLNVGGCRVVTTRDTLTLFPGTRLAALFSGRWESRLQRDRNGRIFMDVNPTAFKKILDFHQFAKIASSEDPPPRPTAPEDLEAVLAAQLTFFGLTAMFERAPAAAEESFVSFFFGETKDVVDLCVTGERNPDAEYVSMYSNYRSRVDRWGTWEANDEAILRLDLGGTKPRLIMWHKRISRIFTIGLPERQDGWRLHIGLHHDNINHMHLMLPSADETALVQ
ncbi:hypothetical protein EMIHUDRAFT_231613 [Emiliania huxleyi CCMP1516]|uniref:Potassium channel tetramerisation-type BTB domain-containing protein n=2 Tax=Emiliania huxleyi TaxID=2903 RepID=A0A0D3K7A2_EMIH1|nr:hypothetical protein EMIHUDRAFT_231613 [Emiliania huxleyi CCMP1516]EOD31637.1 hypothetical protein EMIHUDRAFT_231613 [Emiliania huxleyi CCMP1516]|eukprot:XP_005784066.1 hypothetical protein EMIHUDRAFT_231613 [Emiliania huxleyi CCMP1516]